MNRSSFYGKVFEKYQIKASEEIYTDLFGNDRMDARDDEAVEPKNAGYNSKLRDEDPITPRNAGLNETRSKVQRKRYSK